MIQRGISIPVVIRKFKIDIPFGAMVQYILDEIHTVASSASVRRHRLPPADYFDNSTNDDADIDDPHTPAEFLDFLSQPWLQNYPVPKVDTFNHRESKFGWDITLPEMIRSFLNSKLGISSLKLSLPTIDYSLKFEGVNFTERDMETMKIGIQKRMIIIKNFCKVKNTFPHRLFMSSMPIGRLRSRCYSDESRVCGRCY